MPHRLLKFAFRHEEPRMFREPSRLKDGYDVVIIGGGGHGLAAAYYLARDPGIRDIARPSRRHHDATSFSQRQPLVL